jgi:CheY-like chemotaxis protein
LARWSDPANFTVLLNLGFPAKPVKLSIELNSFAFRHRLFQSEAMTQPLALVFYEKLLPGSQLVNRLQDLNYRVQTLVDASLLVSCAEQAKPMLVLVDLEATYNDACAAITELKRHPATRHLPIIGFGASPSAFQLAAAREAGATLTVGDAALLNHLAQILDQALHVE